MHDDTRTTQPGRGWIVPLSLTVMTGFGVILCGFSVYATDAAAGDEFSKTALSVAYGESQLTHRGCGIEMSASALGPQRNLLCHHRGNGVVTDVQRRC